MIEDRDFIGGIFKQNCGDYLKITKKLDKGNNHQCHFEGEFINYPCKVTNLKKSDVENGEVKNYLYPYIFNKACLGIGKYNSKTYCYDIWRGILRRCYDKNYKEYKFYGEKGVTVCDEWLNFQNFAAWYEENSKWNEEVKYELDVDKDILSYINKIKFKIYSPNTCLIIPNYLNGYITNGNDVRMGISFRKNINCIKFRAVVTSYDKIRRHLGTFDNFVEAKDAFAKEKQKGWIKFVNEYKLPENLRNILLQYNFNCEDTEGWRELTNEEIIQKYF